jgi:antitoxin MazE
MSEKNIMGALFTQQRIQILHLASNHDEYTESYAYAWYNSVYPFFEDTDGSRMNMPHEFYGDFFQQSKTDVKMVFNRLCDAWDKKEKLNFYDLEKEYGITSSTKSGLTRGGLINICKYLYLSDKFDKKFWQTLVKNGYSPSGAQDIIREFDKKDIHLI